MSTTYTNIKIDQATARIAEGMRARRGLRSLAALFAALIREADLKENLA